MHAHHMVMLVEELSGEAYVSLDRDAALAKVNSKEVIGRLSRLPVADELRAAFPTGVPGFPNRVRPGEFDAAWQQAGGVMRGRST